MHNMKKHLLPILVLLMTVLLLSSCSVGQPSPGPSDGATPEKETYEQYKAGALTARQEFDQLTEQCFLDNVTSDTISLHYSLADPSAYGITETPITFSDYTMEEFQKNTREMKELRTKLEAIEPSALSSSQQITYRILTAYLNTCLEQEGMELYSEPLSQVIGLQAQLPILLSEYAFYNKQDVDNYLALLEQIDLYFAQLIEFEKQKSEAGLFMSDTALDHVIQSCEAYLLLPDHNIMSSTFNTRINGMSDLSDEEKSAYKAKNLQILTEHFVPAYEKLTEGLNALRGTGVNDKGLYYLPEGKKYYETLVKSNTWTSSPTIGDLRNAIEDRMNKDLHSISQLISENPDLIEQADNYQFTPQEPNEIIDSLKVQISKDFPELPACNYVIKSVPEPLESILSPAFYLTSPMDRYEDNVIYINNGSSSASSGFFTTLAHEGYPGHLYQNVYFNSRENICNLRKLLSFSSYSEGWASYVENYSYTLDNGLDPKLGQVLAYNNFNILGLYALLDINIHYYGWDKAKVGEYLKENYNISQADVVDDFFNSLVENPTNYLEYYVGAMEITNMKETAEETLGSHFNLKEFNQFILEIGPAPFSVITPYFHTWLVSPQLYSAR